MSWLKSLTGWLYPSKENKAGFNDQKNRNSLQLKDRKLVIREELKNKQKQLSQELEQLIIAYDEKLQDLSTRLHSLSDNDLICEENAIRGYQEEIRILIRRLEIASKSRKDLEREMAEWESRTDSRDLHADHPLVRREMARSELVVRGVIQNEPIAIKKVLSETDYQELLPSIPLQVRESRDHEELLDRADEFLDKGLPELETENLIQAIRDAKRESEKWLGLPIEDHDEDALLQVAQYRYLNGVLKILDKQNGVNRDRLEFAIKIRT